MIKEVKNECECEKVNMDCESCGEKLVATYLYVGDSIRVWCCKNCIVNGKV